MLVLSRRVGEAILVHEEGNLVVEIRVLTVKGTTVKLGLTANDDVRIWRQEIAPKDDVGHGLN